MTLTKALKSAHDTVASIIETQSGQSLSFKILVCGYELIAQGFGAALQEIRFPRVMKYTRTQIWLDVIVDLSQRGTLDSGAHMCVEIWVLRSRNSALTIL